MDTPICDFVRQYAQSNALRLHMPGHKGQALLGMEMLDITEIEGADSLYQAEGIISQSEKNAGALFGCHTLYSTEGSSQCIRAMLYLATLQAKQAGVKPRIAAARNVHKAFLTAAALLDFEVLWLYPKNCSSYLSCDLDVTALDAFLSREKPCAVYVTSPDYLGSMQDIRQIAQVCHDHGVLLLVDNAHGAYLKFLPRSLHPMDLGADMCCDSAHKTLPVLTGGAYLHLAKPNPQAKNALALFGSTSPSYLILQSLDMANRYLESYSRALANFLPQVESLKTKLQGRGYSLYGDEPLKITVCTKPYGYKGCALARLLQAQGVVCEFADPDHLVLMLTPQLGEAGIKQLESALLSIPKLPPITQLPPKFHRAQQVCSIRQAALSPAVTVPAEKCEGYILADATVGCPPAVPILVSGERIDKNALQCLAYYGINHCTVLQRP